MRQTEKIEKLACAALVCLLLCACRAPAAPTVEAPQPAPQAEQPPEFRFVVMGDNRPWWQGKDVITQNEHFLGNIERANAAGADFAVIVGDLIHGYTEDAALLNKEWDAFDEACKRFAVPYYLIVGNHDVSDQQSQDIWLKRRGPLYFSWDHKECHFIALDSDVVGETDQITGPQLDWLKQDLEKAKSARRIFVFLHRPLWDYPPLEPDTANQWNRDIHPLLASYGVDTVFAGHQHVYTLHPARDGVRYVITGGAGAEIGQYELEGSFFHILCVDVAGASSSFHLITARGEVPPDVVTLEKIEALWDAASVEPLERLPRGRILTMPVTLQNPLQQTVKAVVDWDTKGTSWQTVPVDVQIPAGSIRSIAIVADPGDRLFPLPKAELQLVDADRKLYGWPFLDKAVSRVARFVTEWNVVGPFDLGFEDKTDTERQDKERYAKAAKKGWDEALPPEQKVDLTAVYAGKQGAEVRWQPIAAEQGRTWGHVNLDAFYGGKEDYAVACAAAYIHSPKSANYQMTVGSDDSVLVRINGRDVFRYDGQRAAVPDENTFEAPLQEGWNQVLVKVADRWGGWGFYLRVVDPTGTLKFAGIPPEQAGARR